MQIGRWGNSLAVRLPKELVARFGLKEGEELDTTGLEQTLEAERVSQRLLAREEALRRIAETRWKLPPDWKFDREEANSR